MTSKRLFCRAMKEDLRHKLWMAALSCLAGFLAHPVYWLMSREAMRKYISVLAENSFSPEGQVQMVLVMYSQNMLFFGGFVAITSAVVFGMFSFRFLFRRSSVDLYHSLPVNRRTLFALCYLDGFLIWFVPSGICSLASVAVMGGLMAELGGLWAVGELLKTMFFTLLFSGLAFLIVYNLVLTAVMISGNILNTLVSMGILGFGAIALVGLGSGFLTFYMDTFYFRAQGLQTALYGSPLILAPELLCLLYYGKGVELPYLLSPDMIKYTCESAAVAAFWGICAWLLYRNRESEHAEQGIRSRVLSSLMRFLTGVVSGMCGWIFFSLLAGENHYFWGGFGALLTGVLAFGVLDIIFHMEFRAFFAHKIQMAFTLAAALLLCCAFEGDWFGYDTRLPEKEEIEAVGIYSSQYTNRQVHVSSDSDAFPLENIKIEDMDIVYPFLEHAAAWQEDGAADLGQSGVGERVYVKVMLKNGESYYRIYRVPREEREVLLPLLTDLAYLRETYLLDEERGDGVVYKLILARGDSRFGVTQADPETIRSIVQAYNQDLLESPETIVTGKGRMLASVQMDPVNSLTIEVYDSMERTVEAMRQAGLEDWVKTAELSEVAALELGLEYGYGDGATVRGATAEELILAARLTYGIYGEASRGELEDRLQEVRDAWEISRAESSQEFEDGDLDEYSWKEAQLRLEITEPKEIEELLEIVSYAAPDRQSNLFREDYVRIEMKGTDGKEQTAYIQEGKLPEKYILRFGNLKY